MKKFSYFLLSSVLFIGTICSSMNVCGKESNSIDYNGHTYELFDNSMTWNNAKQYCESVNGHLATITSEEEQNTIETLLENGQKKQYWIGLTMDNPVQWITGETVTYSNWDKGEPNNNSRSSDGEFEKYVHIYNVANPAIYGSARFKWNDMFYDNTYPGEEDNFSLENVGFICEWENSTPTFEDKTSNWALSEIEEAYENNLIPDVLLDKDLSKPITRSEFASVSLKLYEALKNTNVDYNISTPFMDIDNVSNYHDIQNVYGLGIAVGTSPNTFEPNTQINREQLVTMLCRAIKKYKYDEWTIDTDNEYILLSGNISKKFADDDDISDFARDSVYFMSEIGIVNGIDNTHFAPKNITDEQSAKNYTSATREQAIAISLRVLKKSELFN